MAGRGRGGARAAGAGLGAPPRGAAEQGGGDPPLLGACTLIISEHRRFNAFPLALNRRCHPQNALKNYQRPSKTRQDSPKDPQDSPESLKASQRPRGSETFPEIEEERKQKFQQERARSVPSRFKNCL